MPAPVGLEAGQASSLQSQLRQLKPITEPQAGDQQQSPVGLGLGFTIEGQGLGSQQNLPAGLEAERAPSLHQDKEGQGQHSVVWNTVPAPLLKGQEQSPTAAQGSGNQEEEGVEMEEEVRCSGQTGPDRTRGDGGHPGNPEMELEADWLQVIELVQEGEGEPERVIYRPAGDCLPGSQPMLQDDPPGPRERVLQPSEAGTEQRTEARSARGESPLPREWAEVLRAVASAPYQQRDLVGLWAHLLASLDFPEGTAGKKYKEFKSSQAVALEAMSKSRDILVDAMRESYPAGAEEACAQRTCALDLARRAMGFRHFTDHRVEWPFWLRVEGLRQLVEDLERHWRERAQRHPGPVAVAPPILLDAKEPARGRVGLAEWLQLLQQAEETLRD